MKKLTLLFSALLCIYSSNLMASGVDSLNITNSYITVGETWYTDYFTSYSVYTHRSFFTDENGGLHTVFVANYKLYYCHSLDSGMTWSTEQVTSTHDGDIKEAVLYVDAGGNPFIAVTINPHFDYGNPTGVNYGEEFRYSVLFFYLDAGEWQEEEIFDSTVNTGFSGNFGCRVNELYKDMDDQLVLIASRYGWYTYGGEIWEFVRDVDGVWSDYTIIQGYNDTPVDHATGVSRIYLKENGERDVIYSRSYNANGVAELVNLHFNGVEWVEPNVLTTDLLNHASWDLAIGPTEEMYLIHFSNDPAPHINLFTDFESSIEMDLDLSMVDTISAVRIHMTEDGLVDLFVYPINTDTTYLYVSEDLGISWGNPMILDRSLVPGIFPVNDQFSDQGSGLEYVRINRVSTTEPYGPDSLFYFHIEQINTIALNVSDVERIEDQLQIYPNPVREKLNLNYSIEEATVLDVMIFSVGGKLVFRTELYAERGLNYYQIDTSFLMEGTYILQIQQKGKAKDAYYQSRERFLKLPLH